MQVLAGPTTSEQSTIENVTYAKSSSALSYWDFNMQKFPIRFFPHAWLEVSWSAPALACAIKPAQLPCLNSYSDITTIFVHVKMSFILRKADNSTSTSPSTRMPNPSSTNSDVIVNIVFGLLATALALGALWQGHKLWKMSYARWTTPSRMIDLSLTLV